VERFRALSDPRGKLRDMKILTATATSQGARDNDFTWAVEGELVLIQPPCATDKRDPDGRCGCGRAFAGISSHRATTTAQVRDLPLSYADVTEAYGGYLESAGFGRPPESELARIVNDMIALVVDWEPGAIVERRLDVIKLR
jgi:hypothetical protein